MKRLTFLILLFIGNATIAQDYTSETLNLSNYKVIQIKAKYDSLSKSVIMQKRIRQTLKNNEQVVLRIVGLNSAQTSAMIKTKERSIHAQKPDILELVLPGLSGISSLGTVKPTLSEQQIVERLDFIKNKADSLHKLSSLLDQRKFAKDSYHSIIIRYKMVNPSGAEIDSTIKADIQYFLSKKEFLDSETKLRPDLSPIKIAEHAESVTTINKLNKSDYLGAFQYIKNSIGAIDTINSKVFSGTKDLVELDIILVDTYTKDTLASEQRTVYTKGSSSFGLSFSTGFFYTERFSDKAYYLKTRIDENVQVLEDKQAVPDVSIGGLGHLFYKISTYTKISASMGLAVSPFDSKSRYLLGGSLLLGREKIISFTFGSSWGKVKQLSSAAKNDDQGQYLPKGATTVPTYDRLRNSWFVGVGYNLTSTRK